MVSNAVVRYKGEIKSNSWATWLVGRTMRRNKNNLVSVVGKTGSGKTLSAISICEEMTKIDGVEFNINDHVVFSLTELMDLINSKKLKRGSKIIFDEPQISISAREFQSEANKVFNYLLSTFRHRNLTLFFCTPFETLLDKNTRRLFHVRIETLSINTKTQTCRLKPRYIEYSDFKADPYTKQLIIFYKEKGINKNAKMFWWDVHRPTKQNEEQYEVKKLNFTDNLNKNISMRLKKYNESGKSLTADQETMNARKPLSEPEKKSMIVVANVKGTNRYKEASEIDGRTMSVIHEAVKRGIKKGYSLDEFKKDKIINPNNNFN